MWRNPNYPAPAAPAPPAESGQRLGTFPRGPGVELHVNLATFEGRPFVSLRVWERGQDGAWWPVKGKGCSVRLSEASGLMDALQAAIGAGGEHARQLERGEHQVDRERPAYVDKGRPQRPPFDASRDPSQEGGGGGTFDEFEGSTPAGH